MDECLPLGDLSTSALRMLLEGERDRRGALEQEVLRLQAGLARQNGVILRLERREAEREREMATMRTLVAGLTEQNALLRRQVAALQGENTQLRGGPPAAEPTPQVKPATPPRPSTTRKMRDPSQNAG